MICDNCKKELDFKKKQIIAINDSVGGCSVMDHHNFNNWILVDEDCQSILRQQLVDESCWDDLSMLDSPMGSKYFMDQSDFEQWSKDKKSVTLSGADQDD